MIKLATMQSITAILTAITSSAGAITSTAKSVENLAKLGEHRTDFMVQEQSLLLKAELADLEGKVSGIYKEKKKAFNFE